jgi:hypothetical protein
MACTSCLKGLHDPLFLLDFRDQFIVIELFQLFSLLEGLVKTRECFELGEHSAVELVYALEGLLANCFLVVCKEEASKVFIQEKVPRVVLRLWHAKFFQMLSNWIDFRLCIFEDQAIVLLLGIVNIPVCEVLHESFGGGC